MKTRLLSKLRTEIPETVTVHAIIHEDKELVPGTDWKIQSGCLRVSKRFAASVKRKLLTLQYTKSASKIGLGWLL